MWPIYCAGERIVVLHAGARGGEGPKCGQYTVQVNVLLCYMLGLGVAKDLNVANILCR
jgi:hypothetical protein